MRQILRSRCLDTKLICSYRNLEALSLRKTLSNGDEDADELELDKESSDGDEYQSRGEDGTATDKELSITLPEFRESKMMLKCEVKAKREISSRVSLITKSGEVYKSVAKYIWKNCIGKRMIGKS